MGKKISYLGHCLICGDVGPSYHLGERRQLKARESDRPPRSTA